MKPTSKLRTNSLTFGLLGMLIAAAPLRAQESESPREEPQIEVIPDARIAAAVENELWDAKSVDANRVQVRVNAGIVTLTGTTKNAYAKKTAARLARMTKGVRAIVNRIDVHAPVRDDDAIEADVVAALAGDPATESWELDVTVNQGVVTLQGTVDSDAERRLAEMITLGVIGVRSAQNNLAVDYHRSRTDAEIAKEIREVLGWDIRLDDELIRVSVNDGNVALSGTVGSDFEKQLAGVKAWVAGVNNVDASRLSVEWWTRDEMTRRKASLLLSDDEIFRAVTSALRRDPRVSSFQPEVDVQMGVVTLSGVVDNLKAKRAAAQDAANTIGVKHVRNFLKVQSRLDHEDLEIALAVRTALKRDVFVNEADIAVDVEDGVAKLYGNIDSHFEKFQAGDVASRVRGVVDVWNYLSVAYPLPRPNTSFYDWDPTAFDFDFDYITVRSTPDHEIRAEILSELWWSPWVDADKIEVTVDDGVATLTGELDSWSARRHAAENALEGGAVRVINKLTVSR